MIAKNNISAKTIQETGVRILILEGYNLISGTIHTVKTLGYPLKPGSPKVLKVLSMVKPLCLTIILLVAVNLIVFSQGKSVVVGTMVDRPNAILVLNPQNGDQGLLIPQLTTAQRLSFTPASPQDDGLMIFDATEKSFYYWSAGIWNKGLGSADPQLISYDPATQRLTLTNGGQADLSTLKEIPPQLGNAGRFLSTNGTTVNWSNTPAGDVTGVLTAAGLSGGAASGDVTLSVNTDGSTISVNGTNQLQLSNGAVTSAKIASSAVNSTHIVDGTVTGTDILDNSIGTNDIANTSITGTKIANGAVATTHISTGGNSKVLTTDVTGVVTWVDRSTFTDDDQGLTLTGNTLNIDNGTAANLNALTTTGDVAGPLSSLVIQPNAVNSGKIQDGSVATTDINSGGNNKVLTTNGAGVVNWTDRSTFTDNQNLGFSGNTLTIDNGTSAILSANGQVTGLLDNLVIQPGAANQVMVTNPAGTARVWTTPGGDITGPLNTTTVGRIQGRNVTNVAPNSGEALIWNGAAWAPAPVTVPATIQFYSVDPSSFVALEPGGNNSSILGLYEGSDTFVFAKGSAREIISPLNLPDGATMQSFTVYYEYSLLLGPITISVFRKNLAGGPNQVIGTLVTPLIGIGVQNATAAAATVVDNSIYSYRVRVTFTNLLNVTDPALALQRIHGVRIQYTK